MSKPTPEQILRFQSLSGRTQQMIIDGAIDIDDLEMIAEAEQRSLGGSV